MEVLTVVVVMGTLVRMAVPSFHDVLLKARATEVLGDTVAGMVADEEDGKTRLTVEQHVGGALDTAVAHGSCDIQDHSGNTGPINKIQAHTTVHVATVTGIIDNLYTVYEPASKEQHHTES